MLRRLCHGMGHSCAPALFGPLAVLSLAVAGVLRADDEPPAKSSSADPASPEKSTSPHQSFKRYEIGEGPRSYWIFEPDEPKPEGRAPVVVFLHGWFAVNPGFYGGWIDHLVRDGKIVIFPRYQNDVFTPPQELLPNALAAIRDALGVLANGEKHVHADLSRFTLIGHSAGGNLAAQIAAVAADPHSGLPFPKALIIAMPGEIVPTARAQPIQYPRVNPHDRHGRRRGRARRRLASPADLHSGDGHPSLAEAIRPFSVGSTWSPAPDRGTHSTQRHALPSRQWRRSLARVPDESG